MKPKYKEGQRLEIHGFPTFSVNDWNGYIVTVKHLPGWSDMFPTAYGVIFPDGEVRAAVEEYLRPYPPSLPNGRGDIDTKTSWEQFEKATGLCSDMIRNGRPTSDY